MANSFTSCPNCGTPIPAPEGEVKTSGADPGKLEKKIRAELEERYLAEMTALKAELHEKSKEFEKIREIEADLKHRERELDQKERALKQELKQEGDRAHDKKRKKNGDQAAVDYLAGSEFKPRLEALIAALKTIKDDLEGEKSALEKIWEKRVKQVQAALKNTAGLYGDLQVGSSLAKPKSPENTSSRESEY